MRSWVLPLVLLGLAAPAAAADVADSWRSLEWRLPECRMAVAYVDVEPQRARSILPPRFEPATWGPRGQAKFLVEFAECGELEYGNWEAVVVPPPERARDEVLGYYVKFDTLVQNVSTRETLAAWGLPARDGTARVDELAPGLYAARMRMDGVGAFFLNFTTTGQPPAPVDFPFLEFTPTSSGALATWDVALRDLALAGGVGVLTLPPESALARLAGASQVPVEVWAGEWSALEGTVATPAGVAPFALGAASPSPLAVAVAVAGGAAGAGFAWHLLRWLGVVSAFSRLSKAAVAAHPRRQEILAMVKSRPGIAPSEIRRALGYAPGVVAHHLRVLERHGHVVRHRDGAAARLYEAGAPLVPALPEARARVLALVRERPGSTQQALAEELGVSRWTVAHHARGLQRAGLVRVQAEGRHRRYWPREDA